jgi:hypothetical protein
MENKYATMADMAITTGKTVQAEIKPDVSKIVQVPQPQQQPPTVQAITILPQSSQDCFHNSEINRINALPAQPQLQGNPLQISGLPPLSSSAYQQLLIQNNPLTNAPFDIKFSKKDIEKIFAPNIEHGIQSVLNDLMQKNILEIHSIWAQFPEPNYDLFPKTLMDSAWAIVYETKFKPFVGVISILGSIAVAAHGNVIVRTPTGYRQPLIDQTLMFSPTGTRKTSVFERVKKPLLEYERQLNADFISKCSGPTFKKVHDKLIKQATKKDREVFLGGTSLKALAENPDATIAFVKKEAQYIDKIKQFVPDFDGVPQLFVSGGSLQEFATIAKGNGDAIAIFEDEGDFVTDILTKKNAMNGCLGLVLKGYDKEIFVYNSRKEKLAIEIAFNMYFFVQGIILDNLQNEKKFVGRGGLARFNLVFADRYEVENCIPDEKYREFINYYETKIQSLLENYFSQKVKEPHVLTIEGNVYQVWKEFSRKIEFSTTKNHIHPELQNYLAKHAGRALRFAGFFHLWNGNETTSISVEEMVAGIALADFLIRHAEFAFDSRGLTAISVAQKVVEWLNSSFATKERSYFTISEAYQGVRALNARNHIPAFEILYALNLINKVNIRGKQYFVVHPGVREPGFVLS